MLHLLWIIPALALLACGWFAASWRYKRKMQTLLLLLQAERKTTAEHAQQMRWQIGHLQAELAARPPLPAPARDERPSDAASTGAGASGRGPARPNLDYAPTAILTDGFPQTMLVRPPRKK